MTRSHHALPDFYFHGVDLHRDPSSQSEERYRKAFTDKHNRPALGTQIWRATTHSGQSVCLKEFYVAEPEHFHREIPDPIWNHADSARVPKGKERGLAEHRAQLFDKMQSAAYKREVEKKGNDHQDFRSQYNAYSFEIEALITQFAQYYGCSHLVQANFWGPLQLPGREAPRYSIEMEELTELKLPSPGDKLQITHCWIDMMLATTQLHSMLIPIRCYPPELIPDLDVARRHPITRPFHYDLSIDQFLWRTSSKDEPPEVVLIDFNASRTAQVEYSTFSWRTIPGKDFYQAPERRGVGLNETGSISLRSNPIYDLYSLMVLGLFMYMRTEAHQIKIQHIVEWSIEHTKTKKSVEQFYDYIFDTRFRERLRQKLRGNRSVSIDPLLTIMDAVFQKDPRTRLESLRTLQELRWEGLSDWMLVPKATDYIARHVMGRKIHIIWKEAHIVLEESEEERSIVDCIDWSASQFEHGSLELGRIHTRTFDAQQVFFIQKEESYPIVRKHSIEPRQVGHYTIYAAWNGCIDFEHPLHIEVQSATPTYDDFDSFVYLEDDTREPSLASSPKAQTYNNVQSSPKNHTYGSDTVSHRAPVLIQGLSSRNLGATEFDIPNFNPQPIGQRTSQHSEYAQTLFVPPNIHEQLQSSSTHSTNGSSPHSTHERSHNARFEHKSVPPHQWPEQPNAEPQQASSTPPSSDAEQDADEHLQHWIQIIPECEDHQHLEFMETYVQNLPCEGLALYTLIHIRSRRCALALQHKELRPESTALQHLALLVQSIAPNDLYMGFLLNNIAVCAYESAYQTRQLVEWEECLGFDPSRRLRAWLNRTDPAPSEQNSAQLWRLRERSRETLDYCHKIRWSLSS